MTNTLTVARGQLTELLTAAGLQAVDHLPDRPQPPLAIITPGVPYLQRGEAFGTHKIGLTVLLLSRTATNEVATEQLDDMLAIAATTIFDADGYRLAQVDPPAQFSVNGATYLGCTADVTLTAVLEVN